MTKPNFFDSLAKIINTLAELDEENRHRLMQVLNACNTLKAPSPKTQIGSQIQSVLRCGPKSAIEVALQIGLKETNQKKLVWKILQDMVGDGEIVRIETKPRPTYRLSQSFSTVDDCD